MMVSRTCTVPGVQTWLDGLQLDVQLAKVFSGFQGSMNTAVVPPKISSPGGGIDVLLVEFLKVQMDAFT